MQQGCYDLNTRHQHSKARFAMDRLQFGVQESSLLPISAPPYDLLQDKEGYSILFNMFGIPESKIKISLDAEKKRLTIFAERQEKNLTDQFLWVFALPPSADPNSLETYYKNGVVQFKFQKHFSTPASVV